LKGKLFIQLEFHIRSNLHGRFAESCRQT